MFNDDKSSKHAADTVYHLIHEVWTTNASGTTSENGLFEFRGFYGEYELTLPSGEKVPLNFTPDAKDTVIYISGGTSAVEDMLPSVKMTLFPNPTQDKIFITISEHTTRYADIYITDLQGKTVENVFQGMISPLAIMEHSVQNLAPGMYIVVVQGENWSARSKFIVNEP